MSRKNRKRKRRQQQKQQQNTRRVHRKVKFWRWLKRKWRYWVPLVLSMAGSAFKWFIENYDSIKAIFVDLGGHSALLP